MEDRTLYEADVTDLKLKGRRNRIRRSVIMIGQQLALMIILIWAFRLIGLIIFFIVMITFLQYPIYTTPDKYKITPRVIVYGENKIIPLKKENKLQINEEDLYVSVCHHRRGEFLRLYTQNPKIVHELLEKLISQSD